MAEMSVPVASLQSFPKSPLCSLSTRKFNSSYGLWVSSATASPSPRFCLISTYNSFRFCAAVVNAASSPQRNRKESMVPPYNVLITGGSKGIGYALAKEFLKAGDSVIICSRSDERVVSAVDRLRVETGKQHVWGTKCDVREGENVKNLVAFAKQKLKYIDIWVFNLDAQFA